MMLFILKSAMLNLVCTSSVYAFDAPFLRGSAGVSLCYLLSVKSDFEAPIDEKSLTPPLRCFLQVHVEEVQDYCQSGQATGQNEAKKM